MAERLLAHALIAEEILKGKINVISAGVAAGDGYPPSENSVVALKKVGIDLSDHLTQQLTSELLREVDYIFGMTETHLDSVCYCADRDELGELYLMRDFIENNTESEIPDPFGMGFETYEYARDSMVEAIPSIVQFLKNQLNKIK